MKRYVVAVHGPSKPQIGLQLCTALAIQQHQAGKRQKDQDHARLNNLVRHERGHVGGFAEELVRARGVSFPHQLQAALQVGLPLGSALLLFPCLGGKIASVEDKVGLHPVAQEEVDPSMRCRWGGGRADSYTECLL